VFCVTWSTFGNRSWRSLKFLEKSLNRHPDRRWIKLKIYPGGGRGGDWYPQTLRKCARCLDPDTNFRLARQRSHCSNFTKRPLRWMSWVAAQHCFAMRLLWAQSNNLPTSRSRVFGVAGTIQLLDEIAQLVSNRRSYECTRPAQNMLFIYLFMYFSYTTQSKRTKKKTETPQSALPI